MIVNIENELYLGRAPTHIADSELYDYFLFVFEYTWSLFREARAYDNIKAQLKEHLKKLFNDMDLEKKWWSLILHFIKGIADNNGFYFLSETAKSVHNKLLLIDNKELAYYCAQLNLSLRAESRTILIIRPLELTRLKVSIGGNDSALRYFVDNKDRFVEAIKESVGIKCVNVDYVFSLMSIKKEITDKFTDIWNVLYELIFTWYISVIYKIEAEYKKTGIVISEEASKRIILRLLVNALYDEKAADKLSERLNYEMKDRNFL